METNSTKFRSDPLDRERSGLKALADAGLVTALGDDLWGPTPKGRRLMQKVKAVRARSEPDPIKALLLLAHLNEEGLHLTLDDGDSVVAEFMEWSVGRAKAALDEAAALGLITPD